MKRVSRETHKQDSPHTYLLSRPVLSLDLSCIWIIIQMNGFQWMRLVSWNGFKLAAVQGHRDSVLCVHLKEYAYISALSCIGKATNNTDILLECTGCSNWKKKARCNLLLTFVFHLWKQKQVHCRHFHSEFYRRPSKWVNTFLRDCMK